MNKKITYSLALDVVNESVIKKIFELSKKKDRTAISVELSKEKMQIRNVKDNKYYTAHIEQTWDGKTRMYDFKDKKGDVLLEQELDGVAKLIPEYIHHIISAFNISSGDFYFKILHPILIFTEEGMKIQLDIFMIYFDNRIYFLIEPIDFENDNDNIEFNKDIHEIKINKYLVMDNTVSELKLAEELVEENTKNRLKKKRYFWHLYKMINGELKFQEKMKSISREEYYKIFQDEVIVDDIGIDTLIKEYYDIETSCHMLNNYFTDNVNCTPQNMYTMTDNKEFTLRNGVQKVISPYYNISIYNNYSDKEKYFIENTLEGLLILNIFGKYEDIFASNNINPHDLSKILGINKIADYENLSPYFYDFYEYIKQLKQFKRLENKLNLKHQYSTACYEKEMLKYQKRSNTAIIILTIISTLAAVSSIAISIISTYYEYVK